MQIIFAKDYFFPIPKNSYILKSKSNSKGNLCFGYEWYRYCFVFGNDQMQDFHLLLSYY